MTAVTFRRPAGTIAYPDTPRYKGGFGIASSSRDRVYKISFDAAPSAGYWVCSCPGGIRWGQCKHLTALALRGRKYGRQQLPEFVK
jgi:hypothetical protein